MSADTTRTGRPRRRNWYDDPIVESERQKQEPSVKVEAPMVADHHAATVLYDANERPIRRRIGFK